MEKRTWSYNRGRMPFPWKGLFKCILGISIICVPLVIIFLLFKPLAQNKNDTEIRKQYLQYQLPADYTKEDIIKILALMKKDTEFTFYFHSLSEEQITTVMLDVIMIMEKKRDAESLFKSINELKEDVRKIATLFAHLNIPVEYYLAPKEFPRVHQIMWQFLEEEFKLTFLGVCYKGTYDEAFSFGWEPEVQIAAQKLRRVVARLKDVQQQTSAP